MNGVVAAGARPPPVLVHSDVGIQEMYGVPIADDVVQVLSTPRKLLDFVNSRLAGR